ncbi:hypothetical protein [Paenibacillus sp. FSL W7-1287]|uniref:hypothetical protein n=1 Tax=Paenibacillus sp. FSL W7-1287 TaxID=2954538 RepID=UPI0030F7044E
MKWKNRMKRTATTTSAILIALMLAACSDNNNNAPTTPTATPDTEQEQTDQGTIPSDNLPEDTGVLDPGTLTPGQDEQGSDSEDGNNTSNDPELNESISDVIKAEGTYIGAADSHTVEIQVGESYLALQVDEDLQHIISEYHGDEAVSFEYVEKTFGDSGTKQLWLESIEKK